MDDTGDHRMMIVPSHWKVCSTVPAAGAARATGDRVTLHAVKTSETCP